MLHAILDSLTTHLVVIDRSGSICYVNESWKQFAQDNGMSMEDQWLNWNYIDVCQASAASGDTDAENILAGLQGVIHRHASSFNYEYPCHSDIEKRWYFCSIVPLKEQPDYYLISHQSVTHHKRLLHQAEKLSFEDVLTGLNNRRGLEHDIEQELSRAERDSNEVSFVVFDIDNFKPFNDRFGHVAGDRCLKTVAKIIGEQARRPGDIAARIGGDEFVLVLTRVSNQQAQVIAGNVTRKIDALNMVIDTDRRVSISAGVSTMVPKNNGTDFQTLYYQADEMLYVEKRRHASQVVHKKS